MEDNKASSITTSNCKQKLNVTRQNFFQCRYTVALLGFFTYVILNVQIISTSVSIVAMVNNSAIQSQTLSNNGTVACIMNIANTTQDTHHESQGEFEWDPAIQGYILGASNLGFAISHLPGGLLAEMVGGKVILLSGIFVSSVSHFMSPIASWGGSYSMIAVQLFRGLGQGLLPASNFVLAANWIPRHERGIVMSFIMSGLCIGAILGGVASGALCASSIFGGWPSVYYIFGGFGFLLSLSYIIFIYESPKRHPRISDAERKYITDNQETDLSKKRPPTPWRKILTSVPFYAMTVAVFGNFWATSHFLSVHPTFLGTILHFTIEENGLFSSVPFALQTVFTLLASWVSEWLIRNNYVGLNKVRKGFTMLSCVGYSGCVFGLYMAGCDKMLSTVFSVLAIGFGGFANAGCMINPIDLSPTFTGSIMGLCSLGSTSAMYIVPVVVGNLTYSEQTLEQWNKMFFISIAVVMASGIIFCVFGSAEVQPWNFPPNEDQEKNKSGNIIDQTIYAYDNPNYHPDSTSHL